MLFDPERALELLRIGSGISDARFRDGQEQAICNVVAGKQRQLVVQKTGWGKSFVYFIAVKLLREAGQGPTLLISPLLALMRNQIAAAERMGVMAATIHSENQDDWPKVEARVLANDVDILLISPERLANERFRTAYWSVWRTGYRCWWSTRPTAFPTGATTFGPTIDCWIASPEPCRQTCACWRPRQQPTIGSWTTCGRSWGRTLPSHAAI